MSRPDFEKLAKKKRGFKLTDRELIGHIPTIALTPVVDGRTGAYEPNQEKTWEMVTRVYDLITENITLPDGTPIRVVVAPEMVYGPRTGALAQEYYTTQGVSANIWISRSWSYSDELMNVAMGIGSSEWHQAAYGLNQTDRPGAVWLKAFTAAMDEKKRPIFAIYNPDLEDEKNIPPFCTEKLLQFARCATAAAEVRGKNYLSVGSVSMGIIGSDVRRNIMQNYLGMGTVSYDMVGLKGRLDNGLYDHEEFEKAFKFMKKKFKYDYAYGSHGIKRPMSSDELLATSIKMTMIIRDLMVGNPRLADKALGKKYGFKADIEHAQGFNAIAAGTQGQRQWTDLYPNFDMAESLLNSSFDWNGFRAPKIIATENDSKNAIGMLFANLLSGMPQLFADIRTNWTPESIKNATGVDVSKIAGNGLIDKRNSGSGALNYALDVIKLVKGGNKMSIQEVAAAIRSSKSIQNELMDKAIKGTTYTGADLVYFPGDGLSSNYRSPGNIPMTSYRYNVVGENLTCSIVEGKTVQLPKKVADHISSCTNESWPETYWVPRDMTSYEYMRKIGPNHDGNSFGLIGADMITLNAMLRIPVDMHNIDAKDIFRPTIWDRFAGDDFRTCTELGPLY